ncbi:MAG: phosphoribosylamine--glycine ligase [Taibaiella sp.]|nr:phosphoribosylamine--glycine ligase [Taibaiella sp.]
MNILLLGSGGRECTLAWKMSQSPLCQKLWIAPGNAGTLNYGQNIDIQPTDFEAVKKICIEENIDILFPGNEDPLVSGIYDFIKTDPDLRHIIVVGPSKDGAILEGSKAFSKAFMQRHDIPTAAYAEFDKENYEQGIEYIRNHQLPIVLKADGLAAGKGVIIALDTQTALDTYKEMIRESMFGSAGEKVVIESFLTGIELSVFAFTDGTNYLILPEAKDYKRIGEGDTGPNTGGMGAVSPLPFADDDFMKKVVDRIVDPTVKGLAEEGRFYQGFIFFGLINVEGNPIVIEYNCRMGDPETEVVIPRIKNDLVELILSMNEKKLDEVSLDIDPRAAATVMLVAQGYPGNYEKGKVISGINAVTDSIVFHAGTRSDNGQIFTNGGRVMAVTSYGAHIQDALHQSYHSIASVEFEGKTFRKDIGYEFIG